MVLPLLVPRIRPDPSDKAVGSTQDQTPFYCAWPTRPAQQAGWVEGLTRTDTTDSRWGVTLSGSPVKALGSDVSQPYNSKTPRSVVGCRK